jgi:hypothetical protein
MRRTLLALALVLPAAFATDAGDSPPSRDDPNPMLGVEMSPVPTTVQERLGIDAYSGVLVQDVFPGTAAQAMGMQRGDVIMQVNGLPITSMTDLRNEVGSNRVGDPVETVVRRGNQELRLSDKLREWPTGVPKEPINAEAEKRFREYQAAKTNRQGQQVQQLAGQTDNMAQAIDQLKQAEAKAIEPEAANGPGSAGRPEAGSGSTAAPRRAWRLNAHATSPAQPAVADAVVREPAQPATGPGWRLRLRVGT